MQGVRVTQARLFAQPQLFQRPAQLGKGQTDAGFDRAERQSGFFGNLRMRKVFVKGEVDQITLVLCQSDQGLLHQLLALPSVQNVLLRGGIAFLVKHIILSLIHI